MKYLTVWQCFYSILILAISAKGFSILARKVVHENGVKEFTISKEIKSNNCSCACACAPRKYNGEISLPEVPILTEKSSTRVQYFKIKKEVRKNKCSCSCTCLPISSGRTTIQTTSSSPTTVIADNTRIATPTNNVEENNDHLQSTTKLIKELLAGTTSLVDDVASTRPASNASTSKSTSTLTATSVFDFANTNGNHQTKTTTPPLISTPSSTVETTLTNSETSEEQLTTANAETTRQVMLSTLADDSTDSTSTATLSPIFKAKVANLLNRLKEELMRLRHESGTTPSTADSNKLGSQSSNGITKESEIANDENKTKSNEAMRSSLMKTKFLLEDLKHKVELLKAEANSDEMSKSISIVDQMERKHFHQTSEKIVPLTTVTSATTSTRTHNVLMTVTKEPDSSTSTSNVAIDPITTETKINRPETRTTTVDALEVQKNFSNQLESAKQLLNDLKKKVDRLKVNQSQNEIENTLNSDKPTAANFATTTVQPSTEKDGNIMSNTLSAQSITTERRSTQFVKFTTLLTSVESVTQQVHVTNDALTTANPSTDGVDTVTESTDSAPRAEQKTKLSTTSEDSPYKFAFVTEAPETTVASSIESTIQVTTTNVQTTIDDMTKSTKSSITTGAGNLSTSTDSKINDATTSGTAVIDITSKKESPIVHILLSPIPVKNSEPPAEIPTMPAWITEGSTLLPTTTPKTPVESIIDEKIQQKTRILLQPILSDLFKMTSTSATTSTPIKMRTTTEIITLTTAQVEEDSIQNLENNLANRLEQARQLREEERQLEMLNAIRRESTADADTTQEIHQRRNAIEARLVQLAQAERWHRELIQRYQLRQRVLANAAAKRENDVTTTSAALTTESAEVTSQAVRVSCEPIRNFIAMFRVHDSVAWLKENCEVVKQLHPTANCAQIQQLMSGCI